MIPVHEPVIGAAEIEAITRCINNGDVSGNSDTVRSFEAEFAASVGVRHAIATSSGTAALHLAFAALGLTCGDEVIVPSFAFAACADMVSLTGANPVLVDVDPSTFALTADLAAPALSPQTRALLAVHPYGRPCDLTSLGRLCDEAGVTLVEDAAQALGAQHRGRPVGTFGRVACYSFYANKAITTGEGGMVVTDDDALAERLRSLRNHCLDASADAAYVHSDVGFNYRMPAFSAAVGSVQLGKLNEFLSHKSKIDATYRAGLAACPGIALPAPAPAGDRHAHWAFTVIVDEEKVAGGARGLANALRAAGIETRRFYEPLHRHPGAAARSRLLGPYPGCEAIVGSGLVLPSGNALTIADVQTVVAAVRGHAMSGS